MYNSNQIPVVNTYQQQDCHVTVQGPPPTEIPLVKRTTEHVDEHERQTCLETRHN